MKNLEIHLKFEIPDDYDIDIMNDGLDNKEAWSYVLDIMTDHQENENKDICKFASVKIY